MIVVNKTTRTLSLVENGQVRACFPVLVGQNVGTKEREGDWRTLEGNYIILRLLPDEAAVGAGYYKGLHLSYPSVEDALRGMTSGLIDEPLYRDVVHTFQQGLIPPQETALGGYVAIHGGLAETETFERGTKGCVVMRNKDMDQVYDFSHAGMPVFICT